MRCILFLCCSLILSSLQSQDTFTLKEAMDYALNHSDQINLDELAVENAAAQVTEFKSIGIPKITASVDYQHYFLIPVQPVQDFLTPSVYGILAAEGLADPFTGEVENFEFGFFQKNNLTANIQASAMIFDGSYLIGLKAAKMFKDLQRKSIAITEQEIKANVTKAYIAILISQENKTMIDKNLDNVSKSLNEIKEIYKSGYVEQLDVDRLELSFENLKTESEKLDQIIELSKNVLKFQMNYPLEQNISLTEDLDYLIDLLKVSNVQLDAPLNFDNRAELDQIMTGQELNKMNLDRLKKKNLPTVRAFANYQEALQRADLFDGNEVGFISSSGAGLGIRMPIYDGGERNGQVQQAKIEMEKTDIQLEQFKKATKLQILNARLQYLNAKKVLENREKSLIIVQSIYDKTRIKFNEGIGSSVEVTQAEASLYESQTNYINALYDFLNSKIEIDIATGQL